MASLDLPSETWLKSTKLKESGLQIKSGKFSNDEKARLRDAVERYKEEHDISEEQLQLLIYKRRAKPNHADRVFVSGHKDMWKEIVGGLQG